MLQDIVMLLPEYPGEDRKAQALLSLEQVGGPVVRALSVAARFGISTMLGAVVGNDPAGEGCSATLESRGCSMARVAVSRSGTTRRSHVWVSAKSGSRTIAYSEDPNLEPLAVTPGLRNDVRSAIALHLDGREMDVALNLASDARAARTTVVVDAGGWKPGLDRLVNLADYLVVSETVLRERNSEHPLGTACGLLRSCRDLEAVLLTSGAEGTTIVGRRGITHVPVVNVEVVDTNGAGDAFCGGFLAGLILGRDLASAALLGSGVAAAVCSRFGDHFPSLEEVDALALSSLAETE
jgi:sugar/nucleoside kinase (ribokinase family)